MAYYLPHKAFAQFFKQIIECTDIKQRGFEWKRDMFP